MEGVLWSLTSILKVNKSNSHGIANLSARHTQWIIDYTLYHDNIIIMVQIHVQNCTHTLEKVHKHLLIDQPTFYMYVCINWWLVF